MAKFAQGPDLGVLMERTIQSAIFFVSFFFYAFASFNGVLGVTTPLCSS